MKSPNFSKSQVVDGLLSFKLISKERNHAKEGFYDSVFQAMFQKAAIPDDLFKKYLEVLLETRMMRRLSSLRLTRCEIHGQSGGIVGVTAIALVPIAISKQPVHLALRVEPPFSCIGIL